MPDRSSSSGYDQPVLIAGFSQEEYDAAVQRHRRKSGRVTAVVYGLVVVTCLSFWTAVGYAVWIHVR